MWFFLIQLVLTSCLIEKYKCTTTPDQVFSITPRLQGDVELLKNVSSMHETVLWQPASPDQITINAEVHLFIPASSQKPIIKLLQRYDITHRVLLANAQELIEAQKRNYSTDPRSSTSYYERYHPLEDIYHWINKTSREYSERLQVILIGSSVEKQPLFVLKEPPVQYMNKYTASKKHINCYDRLMMNEHGLSGKGHQPKKAIWMDCGIHAREWISPAFCMWFVQYSAMYYNQHSDITEILDKMDIYVLPVMNPDGYKYSWIENRMWRKNRSRNVDNTCVGTDLNRNFDANWCTKGSSDNPCDETYCGRFPESEPEAAAVSNFIRGRKDLVKLYLSIHSYSQMLIFPYSCSYQEAPNHQELYEIAQEAAMKIKIHYKNNYKFGAGAKSFYLAPGGSDDWAYNLGIDYSFTFELQDNGRYGFLLPPSHISKACSEALTAVKSIALNVIKRRRFS